MSVPVTRVLDPIFGSPILRAANNGTATWTKVNTLSQWQKGTGWQADLYGGAQTGDDWGAMFSPILEIKVPDFKSAMWSYYMTAAQTMGVNLVLWAHDSKDWSKRADITQIGGVSGLGKAAGWNSHDFNIDTTQMVFYGEGTTGTGLTAGTQYKWSQFQSDIIFSTWTIYRISLEYGWEASGTFDHVWLVEAKFNGTVIPFIPSLEEVFSGNTAFAIGKLAANSGVDIGDVDVTSIIPGTAATSLGKAEDAAHSSGDTGIMVLAVRKDAGTTLAGSDGDYAPPELDQHGGLRVGRPVFGEPTLASANNSCANWVQGVVSPLDQKSPTGWLACLYGGVQTGDDWARVSIPVDELLLTKLTPATLVSQWTHYMDTNDYMGVNIVLWVHDPANFANRAEITQDAGDVASAAAWNKHKLATTDHFFYYGEITGTPDTTPTQGTHYTLAQFQADSIFSTYTIYRITLEFGWGATGNTFGTAWLADVQLNGIAIPLKPDSTGTGRIARREITVAAAADLTGTIAPKTPYRLLSMAVHASAVLDTAELLTLTKDSGVGVDGVNDAVIFSDDLFIGSRTSLFVPFGVGYEMAAEDNIAVFQTNGSGDTIGVLIFYQTVF